VNDIKKRTQPFYRIYIAGLIIPFFYCIVKSVFIFSFILMEYDWINMLYNKFEDGRNCIDSISSIIFIGCGSILFSPKKVEK